ncbi:MAG: phosphoribosylformylglycinamidine synthase subunit PurS [Armatimonadota bacterium]|nr:phosphoribosylformylglycinamidine synthase subunit PurS [Armatimonadota bacterium]
MPTVRITIMLKPGVLDAPGQAVQQGLRALGYEVEGVRMGKVVELTVPDPMQGRLDEMCRRFLANPLIETWQIEDLEAVR